MIGAIKELPTTIAHTTFESMHLHPITSSKVVFVELVCTQLPSLIKASA